MKILSLSKISLFITAVSLVISSPVYAANNSTLTQSISAGVLTTDILDSSHTPVASPTAAMSAKTFSFDCQVGANASTGTLGTNAERMYLSNPSAAPNGWTLTIAATNGPTTLWSNAGATRSFDFNDPTASGCSDGADADTKAGQLAIDPSVASLVTDCSSCTTTGVTKGPSSAFAEGTVNSLTLLSASASADQVWRGYLSGASLKQTIPGETPADNYTLGLTLTATAL